MSATDCWCERCDRELPPKPGAHRFFAHRPIRMNLCPQCGDKRCPRAADHRNGCQDVPWMYAEIARMDALIAEDSEQ